MVKNVFIILALWLFLPLGTVSAKATSSQRIISGVVLDSLTKNGLLGASVYLKDTRIGTATTLDGKFVLHLPKQFSDSSFILKVNYVGYTSKQLIVKPNDTSLIVQIVEDTIGISCIDFITTDSNGNIIPNKYYIRGVVIDEFDSLPLIGVTISITGTKYKTTTDTEGRFKLNLPNSNKRKDLLLEISYPAFQKQKIQIKSKDLESEITIYLSEINMDGFINTVIIKDKPLTRWQKIKGFFRRLF